MGTQNQKLYVLAKSYLTRTQSFQYWREVDSLQDLIE